MQDMHSKFQFGDIIISLFQGKERLKMIGQMILMIIMIFYVPLPPKIKIFPLSSFEKTFRFPVDSPLLLSPILDIYRAMFL